MGSDPSSVEDRRKGQANNDGVPFSLTEEFSAAYNAGCIPCFQMASMLILERGQWNGTERFGGRKGTKNLERSDPDHPIKFWDSVLRYPCGAPVLQN
jgi:hypothetical protein